ncbi:M16 family metallopeptidase [Arcanobacterium pinnipediorum]|uniref:Insulinase family protein n=1 Tax=Arcanobacterium pinnipediorum TaxID=1503041 RepID=A0ABY5AJP7_9ACTO|nr:pitrilysin family protein [Arcanobacterium pinnipediorum]USR79991.1 insulinase family protein [Arcanobacterium pinnipediorum]
MTFTTINLPMDTYQTLTFVEDGILGQRTILPGGVRVLTEKVPGQRSVSAGFWVSAGSRDEEPGREGSTHFLEHMLFKGTDTQSAADISALGDFLGGTLNAATARQYTSYYGRVFAADLPQLMELLIDMLTRSVLDEGEMEIERGVILEELAAGEDDVTEVAEHALLPLVMGDHPLARPVGGTAQTVAGLKHSHMLDHYNSNYQPHEIIFTAVGDVDHQDFCELVQALLLGGGWKLDDGVMPAKRRRVSDIVYSSRDNHLRVERPGRQTAVAMGWPGLKMGDEREYTAMALELILGGGPSSRLFQEVREKRGLAYSTYAWQMNSAEGGLFLLEAQCQPDHAEDVAAIMTQCLADIAQGGVSQQEMLTAFNQRRAQLVFSAESNSFRRSRLGQSEIFRGDIVSIESSLEKSRHVSAADVQQLAAEIVQQPHSLVIAGPETA